MQKIILLSLSVSAALLLGGCGGADLHTVVKDTKGVGKGAPVVWDGREVGKVSRVEAADGGVRVDLKLTSAAMREIHGDVKVFLTSAPNGSATAPAVALVGGHDPGAPVVKKGARVEEVTVPEKALDQGLAVVGALADAGKIIWRDSWSAGTALYQKTPPEQRWLFWAGVAALLLTAVFMIRRVVNLLLLPFRFLRWLLSLLGLSHSGRGEK